MSLMKLNFNLYPAHGGGGERLDRGGLSPGTGAPLRGGGPSCQTLQEGVMGNPGWHLLPKVSKSCQRGALGKL